MATTRGRTIVTVSFAVGGSGSSATSPQEVIEQANEFIRSQAPAGWELANLNVRDPSYGSEMLQAALTGTN